MRLPRSAAPLLLVLAAAARADTVYLANGNTMEGAVVSRTKTQIVLDIGYGTVTLDAADVVRVVAAGAKKGAAGKAELRRRRFESGQGVPKGAEALDALYREAQSAREAAQDARQQARSLEEERLGLVEEVPKSRERYSAASATLSRLDVNADPRGYNQAVGDVNAALHAYQSAKARLEEIEKGSAGLDPAVRRYDEAYAALSAALAGAEGRALRAGGREQKEYLSWVEGERRAMGGEFRSDAVASETRGDRLIVDALLNGRVRGRFLVDTGATTTVLYQQIAAALKLGPADTVGESQSTVADGRVVKGTVVRLDSIEVGRSKARGTLAAVVPVPGPGFDGLLGMSFLSRFIVRVDTAGGKLILDDLK